MKYLVFLFFTSFFPTIGMAQRFLVEKTEGGSEKVIIDKLSMEDIDITFNQDSADYIIRPNVKKMALSRAKGGVLIINPKSGSIVAKSKELMGSTRLANGFDDPVSDVLNRVCKKYLMDLLAPILTKK